MDSGNVPALPTAGVPERVAVPLRLSTKVMPEGSAPVSESAEVGIPVVVTVNVLATPTANVASGNNTEAVARQNALSVQCVDRAPSPPPKGQRRAGNVGHG